MQIKTIRKGVYQRKVPERGASDDISAERMTGTQSNGRDDMGDAVYKLSLAR